jgi:hypothetical protein
MAIKFSKNARDAYFGRPCRRPILLSVIPFNATEFVSLGECYHGNALDSQFNKRLPFDYGNQLLMGFQGYCHLKESSGLGLLRDAFRSSRQWKIEMPNGKWPIRMPFVVTEFEPGDHDERALVWFEMWTSMQYWPASHTGPSFMLW